MNTEFTIFRVKKGKEGRAEEWMREIANRRAECVDTLEHGKVDESEHEIDKLHCAFWNECLDFDWRPVDMEHVVSFAPKSVDEEISRIDRLNQSEKKKAGKIESL